MWINQHYSRIHFCIALPLTPSPHLIWNYNINLIADWKSPTRYVVQWEFTGEELVLWLCHIVLNHFITMYHNVFNNALAFIVQWLLLCPMCRFGRWQTQTYTHEDKKMITLRLFLISTLKLYDINIMNSLKAGITTTAPFNML